MTVSSATLYPELQHYFNQFVVGSAANKYRIPHPVDIAESMLEDNAKSFIALLFNDSYSYDEYKYLYAEAPTWGCVPSVAVIRLNLYPGSGRYMKINDTAGANTFALQGQDFIMLNALLAYRQDSTALTIVDSTASVVSFDSTSNTLTVNYDTLNTNLSKLIYLYLDLKVRNNINRYNNTTLICDTVLEACYEAYVLDQYFQFVAARGT